MKEIKAADAIEIIKERQESLDEEYLVTDILDFVKDLDVVSKGTQYKFYRLDDEHLILEEYPKDEKNHYFYLCDTNYDDIGDICAITLD